MATRGQEFGHVEGTKWEFDMTMSEADKRRIGSVLARRHNAGRTGFGTLRQLPSGRIQARYVGTDERRYTAPMTFDTVGDADAWLAGVRREIMLGTWLSPSQRAGEERAAAVAGTTLNDLFASYMDEGDLKPRTRDLYTYQWARLMEPTIGTYEAAKITPTDVAEWRSALPPAPRQREQASDMVRAVLNLAVERRLITHNPAASSRRKTRDKRVRRRSPDLTFRLTREQVNALADAMPPERRFAVLLAAGTGLRFGEMAALRRGDLTLSGVTMTGGSPGLGFESNGRCREPRMTMAFDAHSRANPSRPPPCER